MKIIWIKTTDISKWKILAIEGGDDEGSNDAHYFNESVDENGG